MALTTAQQVRLYIQDAPRLERKTYSGDGINTGFSLPHRNITTASAFVKVGAVFAPTGAAFNITGEVVFDDPVSANSAFLVTYAYSVFDDAEIDHFITAGGSIRGAQVEAITTLMFDGLKRASWQSPDGTKFDDTKAMDSLQGMYDKLTDETTQEAIAAGGIFSWGERQG